MTARDFCFWLQGALEIVDPQGLTVGQLAMVKRHLALVFAHDIDPTAGRPSVQEVMNAIHSGKPVSLGSPPQPDPRSTLVRC